MPWMDDVNVRTRPVTSSIRIGRWGTSVRATLERARSDGGASRCDE